MFSKLIDVHVLPADKVLPYGDYFWILKSLLYFSL